MRRWDEALRRSFDDVADIYARDFDDELARKPFDRDVLEAFAKEASEPVMDLGCGPGHVGAFVAAHGPRVIGADFSAVSLRNGKRLHPEMSFAGADARALPFADGSLGGMTAFYCMVYGSDDHIVECLGSCKRALREGAQMLIAVHAGDGEEHHADWHGIPIDITMTYRSPERFTELVSSAGFRVEWTRVREPNEFEHPHQRVYVLARA